MRREEGFTLLEALVALAIVSTVVLSFIGIRTTALIDATWARNWRLARELAEQTMSELLAGARETPPESGVSVPFEKYPGFRYEIRIGESAVAEIETAITSNAVGAEESDAQQRAEWQKDREAYRKAKAKGLDYMEYQDELAQDDYRRRLEENPPSETDFEECAVVVWFPRLNPEHEGDEDAFVIKAKVSTLSITGLTPEQAAQVAQSRGQTIQAANQPGQAGASGGGAAPPGGGGK